jgi:nucleotide-binding universal stress UspA family protein
LEYNINIYQQSQGAGQPQALMGFQPIIKEFRKMHEVILSKTIEKATRLNPTLKITSELKEEDASSQIVETAENGKFDLIVIGHRGDSKIKEFFLGSTSERVAHRAKCAVIINK